MSRQISFLHRTAFQSGNCSQFGRNPSSTLSSQNFRFNSDSIRLRRSFTSFSNLKQQFDNNVRKVSADKIFSLFEASWLGKLFATGWENFPPPKGNHDVKPPSGPKPSGKQQEKQGESSKDSNSKGPQDPFPMPPLPGSRIPEWLTIAGIILAYFFFASAGAKRITWEKFYDEYLKQKKVKTLRVVDKETVYVIGHDGLTSAKFTIGSVEALEKKMQLAQQQLNYDDTDHVNIIYKESWNWSEIIGSVVIPLMIFGVVLSGRNMMNKSGKKGGGGLFNFGQSKAKLFQKNNKVTTTFADVAGLPEAKQEIQEFVDFLKNPAKYKKLGAKLPKGALLVGPPGTGKTLLAKAVAGEAGVPFWSTSGSDFIELYVGVGPARVRDLFEQARKAAPCIVFIDEIDAIGRKRGRGSMGGNDERENTLNQILVEMDGFTPSTEVVVLAGTNRPDVLDSALLRPGRFDRRITVDTPDIKSREEIFMVHLKPIVLAPGLKAEEVAKKMSQLTPGFSGADIANTCNEAALIAARRKGQDVEMKDFDSAIDRIIGGLEKKKVLSPEEKKTVAFHEAGHAVAGWFLEHVDPLLKVSIVPRGNAALGFAQFLPQDKFLYTTEQLLDKMCMTLGGRVAEELLIGVISTGAADDLDKVTKLAYSQVQRYGMNEKIGPLAFKKQQALNPYSDSTAEMMDLEVRKMIQMAYERTKQILIEKKHFVEQVGQVLLQKEIIHASDLIEIMGERPFKYDKATPSEEFAPP